MRRILVTGASGFIGTSVISHLKDSGERDSDTFEVNAWKTQRDGSLLLEHNRRVGIDRYRPNIVLHLAWHRTNSREYDKSSQHMHWAEETLKFALECLRANIWFICAGSALDNVSNSVSFAQTTQYSNSKSQLREWILGLNSPRSAITWLQIQYVFSIQAQRPRLLHSLMNAENLRTFCPNFPDHSNDFIEISDVASAVRTVLLNGMTNIVTVGSGWAVSNRNFIEAAQYALGATEIRPKIRQATSSGFPLLLYTKGWRPDATNNFFGFTDSWYTS